jgi:hypothetical protein
VFAPVKTYPQAESTYDICDVHSGDTRNEYNASNLEMSAKQHS